MSEVQYVVGDGHSLMIPTRTQTDKHSTTVHPMLKAGQRIPAGVLTAREIANKIKDGSIRPVGKPAERVEQLAVPAGEFDFTKKAEPIVVSATPSRDIPSTEEILEASKESDKVTQVSSKWILDPANLEGKSKEELLAMIQERDSDFDMTAFADEQEIIDYLSQDFKAN